MSAKRLFTLFFLIACIFCMLAGCTININIGNSSDDIASKADDKTIFDYIFNGGNYKDPMYKSRAYIYIKTANDTDTAISSSDLSVTKVLLETCSSILQSNAIQDQIREEYPDIEYALSLESMGETESLAITATGENPEYLDEICNTAVSLLCEQIPQIVQGASCKVIDYARQPAP